MKKKNTPVSVKSEKTPDPSIATDNLRPNLAIGILTLAITALLLYILNSIIISVYTPNIADIVNKVSPLSIFTPNQFFPEPTERMQFQLSLICTPVFIFLVFSMIHKKKEMFISNTGLSMGINIAGALSFIFFVSYLLKQNLLYLPDETNAKLLSNNLVSQFNAVVMIGLYGGCAWLYMLYTKTSESGVKKMVTNAVSWCIVLVILYDLILYSIFHLADQDWGRYMETNAVFYSITQVVAGKSLLVNVNSQYGLYAWILCPVFKVIGLSTYKFSVVMGVLNALGYLFIYIGIKRIIKNDLFSLIIFLCVIFWQYWQVRLPHEPTPRFYYQYNPIRFFFPALGFCLVSCYFTATGKLKKYLLPATAVASSFAVFWNLDTGLVLYGSVLATLILSSIDFAGFSFGKAARSSVPALTWMVGSLLFVLFFFCLSTKMHSGSWPDFKSFFAFQNVFYVSGYFMLPMTFIHFWNIPVIIYIAAGAYYMYTLKRADKPEANVSLFLFLLGAGLFAYFQGRSYDTTIQIVMYPSIIILGILSSKLYSHIRTTAAPRFHESMLFFLIPFLFLTDGAFSMIYYIPSIHSYAENSSSVNNPVKQKALDSKLNFITSHIPKKDTVLILAKDYESYYYAEGAYYNPLNLPGSSEMFFRSELGTLADVIRTTRYPIVFDGDLPFPTYNLAVRVPDTISKYLAACTEISKRSPEGNLFILKHAEHPLPSRLTPDAHTICYKNYGVFNKYTPLADKIVLPESFSIEFIATLDTSQLQKANLMFANAANGAQFSGFFMIQNGDDLTQYAFTYGNGKQWCPGVVCKLDPTVQNHILITVQRTIVSISLNDKLLGQVNANSPMANSPGAFFINPSFAGTIEEIKVTAP